KNPATQNRPDAGCAPIDRALAQCIYSNYWLNLDSAIRHGRSPDPRQRGEKLRKRYHRSSSRRLSRSASGLVRGPAAERCSTFPPSNPLEDYMLESLRTRKDAANFPLVMEISAVD